MGGGPRIPYPKHIWSPSGGWYCQPSNWRTNTAIAIASMFGIACLTFKMSSVLEHREHFPAPGRVYPSRNWSAQIIAREKQQLGSGES